VRVPVPPAPLPDRHPVPAATTARRPRSTTADLHPATQAEATGRADPVDRADPDPAGRETTDLADQVGPVDRVDLATTDPVGRAAQAGRETTDRAAPVDRETMDQAAPVDRETTDLEDRVDPAVLGMATTSAATSTAPPGETDPDPGVQASHRGRHGTGHFPRPVDGGMTARSTTGATRKLQTGIRSSTSGASTSSESGSRCNESPPETPASPIGEAGVARLVVRYRAPSSRSTYFATRNELALCRTCVIDRPWN
jgi:hypothetical protein